MKKFKIAYLLCLVAATWSATSISAQVDEFISTIDHRFGESIHFQAEIQTDIPIAAGVVYFQAEEDARTNMGLAKIVELGQNRYQAIYEHRFSDYSIPPFSEINTHWEFFLLNGDVYESAVVEYPYIDNRFQWDTFEENNIQIHWYANDQQLGEMIYPIVDRGVSAIQELLPGASLQQTEIYIYSDQDELPVSSTIGDNEPTIGKTIPELGLVLIALPENPEQETLAEEYISPALMRIQLHQFTAGRENNLPAWLREGLVWAAEINPNPNFTRILKEASSSSKLTPLHSICAAFPDDAEEAMLSSAEAQSFIRYLQSEYGATGIMDMMQEYAKDQDCETGFKNSIRVSLSQAEQAWKRSLRPKQAQNTIEEIIPWIVIPLAVLTAPIIVISRGLFRKKGADR